MTQFIERHPAWALILLIAVAVMLWLILAVWPPGLEEAIGRKRVFLNAVFNGITLGSLYFLVASGFTLIFGLMRNVNLAHGSLYLFGGYFGYAIGTWTGSWVFGFIVAFLSWRCSASSCRSSSSAAWRGRICARPWSPSGSRSCSRT